jgi:hypothetical protein
MTKRLTTLIWVLFSLSLYIGSVGALADGFMSCGDMVEKGVCLHPRETLEYQTCCHRASPQGQARALERANLEKKIHNGRLDLYGCLKDKITHSKAPTKCEESRCFCGLGIDNELAPSCFGVGMDTRVSVPCCERSAEPNLSDLEMANKLARQIGESTTTCQQDLAKIANDNLPLAIRQANRDAVGGAATSGAAGAGK